MENTQSKINILQAEKDFVTLCKAPGQECEHELPQLLAEALGGTAQNFYCVHRLDRAVGGVMVYARSAGAAAALSRQIQEHRFQKEYLAVVQGKPAPAQGVLHDYLYHDKRKGKAFPVRSLRKGVKEAELEYTVLAAAEINGVQASLVHVQLHTGRFHQIRAQFAARKMPLLGDGRYGSREKGCGVALFSCRVGFECPGSKEVLAAVQAPPNEFPWNAFGRAAFDAGSMIDKKKEGE